MLSYFGLSSLPFFRFFVNKGLSVCVISWNMLLLLQNAPKCINILAVGFCPDLMESLRKRKSIYFVQCPQTPWIKEREIDIEWRERRKGTLHSGREEEGKGKEVKCRFEIRFRSLAYANTGKSWNKTCHIKYIISWNLRRDHGHVTCTCRDRDVTSCRRRVISRRWRMSWPEYVGCYKNHGVEVGIRHWRHVAERTLSLCLCSCPYSHVDERVTSLGRRRRPLGVKAVASATVVCDVINVTLGDYGCRYDRYVSELVLTSAIAHGTPINSYAKKPVLRLVS